MKGVGICAMFLLAAAAGCGILGGPGKMDPATSTQVDALLREANTSLRYSIESERHASEYPANSEAAQLFSKAAKLHLQAALDKAYEAYNLEKNWPLTNKILALCKSKMGESDQAIQFAERAMALDPKMDELMDVVGSEYVRKGINATDPSTKKKYYNKAIDAYETFIRKHPDHISVPYLESTVGYLQEEIKKLK